MDPVRKYIVGLYQAAFDLNRRDEARIEDSHEVFFDGRPLLIDKGSPELFISSDFDWGSRSRGSRQTAVSILLEITDKADALRYSDLLVNECLSLLHSHRNFKIQIYAIRRWLNSKKGRPDQETALLAWTQIEDPKPRQTPPAPAPKIIEPPMPQPAPEPLSQSVVRRLRAQTGGNGMEHRTKWPLGDLEVGGYFYFINPTERELKLIGASQSERAKTLGRTFVRRVVSTEWCRAQGLDIPQNVDVCIVWRTA
jgi:hypothetical protein